jgi:hypothetical protein
MRHAADGSNPRDEKYGQVIVMSQAIGASPAGHAAPQNVGQFPASREFCREFAKIAPDLPFFDLRRGLIA